MPVPASYNDITEDKAIRDHVGVVWYDRTFYVPQTWNSANTKVWLRFGGVHYTADVVRLFASP
jgi:beta-glucuronidase